MSPGGQGELRATQSHHPPSQVAGQIPGRAMQGREERIRQKERPGERKRKVEISALVFL